jgi:hypothetical protein
MLERKLLNIYADDRENATIVVAYTTYLKPHDRRKYVDTYSVWIRDDKVDDIDIINFANMLYHEAFVYVDEPISEKAIYKAYQKLFHNKLWENYKVEIETFKNPKLLVMAKPYRNFEMLTEYTMQNLVSRKILKYTIEAKRLEK